MRSIFQVQIRRLIRSDFGKSPTYRKKRRMILIWNKCLAHPQKTEDFGTVFQAPYIFFWQPFWKNWKKYSFLLTQRRLVIWRDGPHPQKKILVSEPMHEKLTGLIKLEHSCVHIEIHKQMYIKQAYNKYTFEFFIRKSIFFRELMEYEVGFCPLSWYLTKISICSAA